MKLAFTKLEGAGNDFVLFDFLERSDAVELAPHARWLCDRHHGVGADGLLLVTRSAIAAARMRVLNPDGSEPEMCGNGLRCVARYLRDTHGMGDVSLETGAGRLSVTWHGAEVRLGMGAPRQVADQPLTVADRRWAAIAVSMGNPHAVIFAALDAAELRHYGPLIECHPAFPGRTNVEFVEVLAPDRARVLVWERGAGPTLACGTGACAVLAAGVLSGRLAREARLELPGGELFVSWPEGDQIYLQGPARSVFQGSVTLPEA